MEKFLGTVFGWGFRLLIFYIIGQTLLAIAA